MTENDGKALCARWLPAWTGNDPHRLLRFYARDAFYRDPARPEGVRGHELLLPYFLRLLSANPRWTWRADEVIATRAGFVLKWSAEIPTPHLTIREQGLDIVEVDAQGLITRNEVYFDRARWLKVLGK